MASLGYGEEYRYAHNEPGAYAAGECYFRPSWKVANITCRQNVALKTNCTKTELSVRAGCTNHFSTVFQTTLRLKYAHLCTINTFITLSK